MEDFSYLCSQNIDQWNPSERAQLLQWLKGLGFDL